MFYCEYETNHIIRLENKEDLALIRKINRLTNSITLSITKEKGYLHFNRCASTDDDFKPVAIVLNVFDNFKYFKEGVMYTLIYQYRDRKF